MRGSAGVASGLSENRDSHREWAWDKRKSCRHSDISFMLIGVDEILLVSHIFEKIANNDVC